MRQYIALFFIGLIAVSTVQSLNQDVSFLKSLKSDDFGNTLIASIQIELKSSTGADAVNRVLAFLRTIRKQIHSDSKADKSKQVQYEKVTNARLARLAARIVNLNRRISYDQNKIRLNNAAIVSANRQLNRQNKHLANAQRALSKNLATQARVTRVYRQRFTQLSAQITALAGARQILVNYNAKSFEQTTQSELVQLSSSLNNIQFQHPKFQGFVSILSEMLSNTEKVHHRGSLLRVVKLIDSLYAQLVKEAEHLTAEYRRRTAGLVQVQKRIERAIAGHVRSIANLKARLARLAASNAKAAQRIKNNQARLAKTLQQQNNLRVALAHSQQAYAARVALRKSQQAIIKRVIRIFKTRFTDAVRASVHVL